MNVFVLASLICLAAAAVARIGITDVVKRGTARRIEWKKLWSHVRKSPGLKLVYASAFASRADTVVLAIFVMTWVVKVARDFGKTPMQAVADGGVVVAIATGLGMLSYPLCGVLAEKWGRLPVLAAGLAFSGVGYILTVVVADPFSLELKLCVSLFAIGIPAAHVGANSLMGDLAPRDMIGSVLGGYHTCAAVGIIVFVQAGGPLFDHVGHTSPFIFTGIADLLVLLCALALWKRLAQEEAATKKTT
jgi:MFS family permease